MKISYAYYELFATHLLNSRSHATARKGALIRVILNSGAIGYADCHPWPELGDLPVDVQLEMLAKGVRTRLTKCAIELALVDATLRLKKGDKWNTDRCPKSHFLITDLMSCSSRDIEKLVHQGFTHVKIKAGRHIQQEAEMLLAIFRDVPLKLRIDVNEMLTDDQFYSFLNQIKGLKDQVDFIEDPFPYHPANWAAIQNAGWKLACDRQADAAANQQESASILILKPAIQSIFELPLNSAQTCLVTSYLGHPLGQVAAAYIAAIIDPACLSVHGLLSHHAYQQTSFSSLLNWNGPRFHFPLGTGFGFDQELEELDSTWRSL